MFTEVHFWDVEMDLVEPLEGTMDAVTVSDNNRTQHTNDDRVEQEDVNNNDKTEECHSPLDIQYPYSLIRSLW